MPKITLSTHPKSKLAPVTQRTEYPSPKGNDVGSNPIRSTVKIDTHCTDCGSTDTAYSGRFEVWLCLNCTYNRVFES